MFELSGYWQRVGMIADDKIHATASRNGCCHAGGNQHVNLFSTRSMEKFLSIPTYVRRGRNIEIKLSS